METIIFLIWFCLVWIIPICFIAAAYAAHLNGRKMMVVMPMLAGAMVIFIVISLALIGPMFEGFFAGGDAEMGGAARSGQWIYGAMVAGYAVFGWLICSVLLGRLVIPGRRLLEPRTQPQ